MVYCNVSFCLAVFFYSKKLKKVWGFPSCMYLRKQKRATKDKQLVFYCIYSLILPRCSLEIKVSWFPIQIQSAWGYPKDIPILESHRKFLSFLSGWKDCYFLLHIQTAFLQMQRQEQIPEWKSKISPTVTV